MQAGAGEKGKQDRHGRPALRKSRFAPAEDAAVPPAAEPAQADAQQQRLPQSAHAAAQQQTPPPELEPVARLHQKQKHPEPTEKQVRFVAPPSKLPSPPGAPADGSATPTFGGFHSRLPRYKATPAVVKSAVAKPAANSTSAAAAQQAVPETPPLVLWQLGGGAAAAATPQLQQTGGSARVCTPGFALSSDVPSLSASDSTLSTGAGQIDWVVILLED